MQPRRQVVPGTRWKQDFDTLIVQNDIGTSVRWAKLCRQGSPPEGLHVKRCLLPQSCGTPIIGPSGSNRLSRRVWTGSDSTIWISISYTLHLPFNLGTSRIRGIKTAISFTTAA